MRDWSTPRATRTSYTSTTEARTPATPTAAAVPDEASDDAAGVERCEICGAAELWWRNCKLVCRNCRSIVKSCADL